MDDSNDLIALAQDSSRRQRFNHIKTLSLLVSGSFFVAYVTLETSALVATPNITALRIVPAAMLSASWWLYILTQMLMNFGIYRTIPSSRYNFQDERVLELTYREERQSRYFMFIDFLTIFSFTLSLLFLSFMNFISTSFR